MIKNDKWIREMSIKYDMIKPFEKDQIKNLKISYGTSSYGYDMRLSNKFMLIKSGVKILDPKHLSDRLFIYRTVNNYIKIPPNSTILGKSVEYFKIPRNILTIAFGKSTYIRCGILINITPFEPEWEGYVTLSIANMTSIYVKVYINEGIAQVLFLSVNEVCEKSYVDKKGKYNIQKIITHAKI
ncbi:MAG: dCTP deaminase [Endomicrobium sp.]|jgi:dCTP deaminase|nr:dCTP deaminase [Endomicrobium sp.]